MSRIIDLSQTIEDNMPVYPGDDPVSLKISRRLAADHYNDHRLTLSMHAGTHIDGPMGSAWCQRHSWVPNAHRNHVGDAN